MTRSDEYDVIVIGGGPAGSSTATMVAQGGHSVLLLELEKFPRFRIGESLMPATYWTLDRMGVLDKMNCSQFPQKHSVQFFSKSGRGSVPFYFSETEPGPSAQTWQVDRGEFDLMLLNNAREKGVEVFEETRVTEVLFDGDRAVGVAARFPDGEIREIAATVVVDASGQAAMLGHKLRLRQGDENLRNCSYYTRYKNAWRGEGRDEGATLILYTGEPRTWFWYIPLPEGDVSVGVVGPIERLTEGRRDPQAVFDSEAASCPAILERIEGAEQLHPVRALKDFTYSCRQMAGDGWILVGDAFGFIDPIYSSGVFLAMKGGEFAADSILAALDSDDVSGVRLGAHAEEYAEGVEAMRKLVYAYYAPEFNFAKFLEQYPDVKDELVNLLIGNVYRKSVTRLLESMEQFCELPGYEPFRIEEAAAN
ncbi:MAG: FAD-dependent oxidoreductase [Acidobacteria bacterium]|nr:FAD-dependent oxidoreductase [Acidobacteriota bacterium]